MSTCSFCYKDQPECECGYIHMSNPAKEPRSQIYSILIISFLIIAALLHLVNWNQHFLTIIPLKMKELSGIANVTEHMQIAAICKERKKSQCEAQALTSAFKMDAKLFENMARAGEVYLQKKQYTLAAQALTEYFRAGGKDRASRHRWAQALKEIGNHSEANKQYAYLIQTDKKDPDFQLAREYVDLLMQIQDYKTAKNVIERYRKKTQTAVLFMDSELKFALAKMN